MKYRMIVFDLDGTLLNTLKDLRSALNYALKTIGLNERSLEEVKNFIGTGIKNLCIKGSNGIRSEEVLALFKEYYSYHLCDETSVYPNIPTLLLNLKNRYILGILSNKRNDLIQKLNNYYFKDIFDFAMGECDNIKRKPSPDMIEYILKKYNLDKKDVLYVGDSDVDITFSENAGIDYVIVDYGYRDRASLEALNPRAIVSNPLDILAYLGE